MKILEICTALDGGGVDRYLLNYCSRIKDVHFDFVAVSGKEGILEEPLRKFGFNIFIPILLHSSMYSGTLSKLPKKLFIVAAINSAG